MLQDADGDAMRCDMRWDRAGGAAPQRSVTGIVIQPPTFQCRRNDLVYQSVIYVIKTRPEGEIEGWK